MRIPEAMRAQMRTDRESGMTLTQLVGKYGRSKSTVSMTVRGCDTSKVVCAAPGKKVVSVVVSKERPNLSKVDIGEASRQMICARLMFNEVKVFRPMTKDTSTDLLVMKEDGTVLKCQCKYVYPSGNGRHIMNLFASRKNKQSNRVVKHRYSLQEVDFFLGYCADNDGVYVIPNSDTTGTSSLAFWVLRSSMGSNGKGIDTSQYLNRFDLLK